MTPCTCLVQDGQISAQTQAALRSKLDVFTQSAFGHPAQFNWIAVPEGSGFTAAKPSTSSLVSVQAGEALAQDRRTRLLNDLCDLWMAETGCSMNEIVGVISDPVDA